MKTKTRPSKTAIARRPTLWCKACRSYHIYPPTPATKCFATKHSNQMQSA